MNQRLIQKIAMRWMDDVFLGICFMVSAVGCFDLHVLAWKAETWFRQILEVYNIHLGMKRGCSDIFVGMDVDVRTQQIRSKQHIDHSRWKL